MNRFTVIMYNNLLLYFVHGCTFVHYKAVTVICVLHCICIAQYMNCNVYYYKALGIQASQKVFACFCFCLKVSDHCSHEENAVTFYFKGSL